MTSVHHYVWKLENGAIYSLPLSAVISDIYPLNILSISMGRNKEAS